MNDAKPQIEVYPSAEKESGRQKPWVEFSDFDKQYKLPVFGTYVGWLFWIQIDSGDRDVKFSLDFVWFAKKTFFTELLNNHL